MEGEVWEREGGVSAREEGAVSGRVVGGVGDLEWGCAVRLEEGCVEREGGRLAVAAAAEERRSGLPEAEQLRGVQVCIRENTDASVLILGANNASYVPQSRAQRRLEKRLCVLLELLHRVPLDHHTRRREKHDPAHHLDVLDKQLQPSSAPLPPHTSRQKRTLHPSLTSSNPIPSTLLYSIPSHSPCPSLNSTLTIPLGQLPSTLSSSPSFLSHPSRSCRSLNALPSLFSLSVSRRPNAACPTSSIRRIWKSVAFARPG